MSSDEQAAHNDVTHFDARWMPGRRCARQRGAASTLGHPLHPVLIAFTIGSWAAATVLDVARADRDARRMLVGLGVLAAAPTALAGASDWLTTTGATRRLGLALHEANISRGWPPSRSARIGCATPPLTWVEGNFSYAIARAGHTDNAHAGTTATYVRANLPEVAAALAALTGEPHPLATDPVHYPR